MTNKKRLIDANALIAEIKEETWKRLPMIQMCLEYICMLIREQPVVDAVEVVRAYWAGNDAGEWHCSRCGEYAADGGFEQTNYCPNCGAKMDGERKDNGKE